MPRRLDNVLDALNRYGFVILLALLMTGLLLDADVSGVRRRELLDHSTWFSGRWRMSDEPEAQIDYQVALPEFEGPLDLLLHLVKKHELDILDIPIAFITEQYLEMLDVDAARSTSTSPASTW